MKKLIPLLLVIIGVALWFYLKTPANSLEKDTFYGNIENRTQKLSFAFLGTIETITKDEGEKFSKGDLLAKLDTTTIELGIKQLQAQIEAEQSILNKLQAGNRKEEIAQAKAALQEAKAVLLGTQDTYERQKQLYEKKATTEQSYILAKTAYERTLASFNKANSYYSLIKDGYQKEDIEAQTKKIAALQLQKKSLEYNLQESALYALTNGTVLTRYVENGSVITPAQSVLEVALEDHYWVRAYVSEKRLAKLKQGEKVLVHSDARDEAYEGYIGFISPVAEFTPKNIETPELRPDLVYRFRVVITNPTPQLKQGMPVTITPL